MLRPLVRLALDLLIALIGLGLLIARAWGWSEYASRDLYVVYYQIAAPQTRYFVVRADGSGAGGQLTWPGDMVYQVACSPDGRALAVLTLDGHLLVLTSAGVVSNRVENPIYSTLSVGNDGTVALFDPTYDTLLVKPH